MTIAAHRKTISDTSQIIVSGSHVPVLIRVRDIILSILLWAMYLYFMSDFFLLMSDVFAWIFHGFSDTASYARFAIFSTVALYVLIIFISAATFMSWAIYNLLRFRRKTRRKKPPDVTAENLATFYKLKPEQVKKWQNSKILVMHHDKKGYLTDVVVS